MSQTEKMVRLTKRRGRKATTLVRLYHLLKDFPLLKNEEISKELGVSVEAIRAAKKRIRKVVKMAKFPYCPVCQVLSLQEIPEGQVCVECGRVFPRESNKVNPFFRSPTNALHFGFALGSDLDCYELKSGKDFMGKRTKPVITSTAPIIASQIRLEDNATKNCLEELMKVVRTLNLPLDQTDALGKMLRSRIKEFRMKYPLIDLKGRIKQSIVLETLASGSIDLPRLKEAYLAYLEEIKSKEKPIIKKQKRRLEAD